MMASPTILRHPSNAQPQGCVFFVLDAAKPLGYDDETGSPFLGNPARFSAMRLALPTLLCGS